MNTISNWNSLNGARKHHLNKFIKLNFSTFILISLGKHHCELFISASLTKVDHRLPEFLFTNTAVVVIVEHPECRLHIIQLVAAVPQDLLSHSEKGDLEEQLQP